MLFAKNLNSWAEEVCNHLIVANLGQENFPNINEPNSDRDTNINDKLARIYTL